MKRVLSIFFIMLITAFSCIIYASAEPIEESAQESLTNITNEIKDEFSSTETDTTLPTEPQTKIIETVEDLDSVTVKNHGYVSFSIDGVETDVIVVIVDANNKEHTLEFTAENNYMIQDSFPVGEYTIKSAESKNKDYKIKDCHLINSESITFEVTETDFMSVKLTATEKKVPYIIGLFKREWYLLIILAALGIAYRYKKTHRVLPSQES